MQNPIDINDELKQRLLTSLDFIGEMTKKGATVAGEQIPLILQDIPRYGIAYHGVLALGFLTGFIIALVMLTKFYKASRDPKTHGDTEFGYGVLSVFSLLAVIGMSFGFFYQAQNVATAAFAPRIFIIQWTIEKVQDLQTPSYNNARK